MNVSLLQAIIHNKRFRMKLRAYVENRIISVLQAEVLGAIPNKSIHGNGRVVKAPDLGRDLSEGRH